MKLCILDLIQITGGKLRLAAMPPLDGELAAIERIVLFADAVRAGDVFWCLDRRACDVDLAFLRGALGVVAAGPPIEPWAGRFSLRVSDAASVLAELRGQLSGENAAELKVLQLCAARGADIYPLTCERPAKGLNDRRCRRQAA